MHSKPTPSLITAIDLTSHGKQESDRQVITLIEILRIGQCEDHQQEVVVSKDTESEVHHEATLDGLSDSDI
jgi:hypothetical protein